MITKFDSSYYGTADMEEPRLHRHADQRAPLFARSSWRRRCTRSSPYAKCMDERGYNTFWMAEHHFQPEGTELIPNLLMMAMHLCGVTKNLKIGCGFNVVPMWHPLRLAEDYAMADILTGGRVIFGVGARLSHPRGRDLRLAADRPERQPRDVRGGRRGPVQGVRGQAVLAPGQVLHDPAGGAVSRLHAEGDHAGAGAGAAAGRMLAADPERLGARLRLHGQVRHHRRDRRRLGRGRRGRAAHARVPGGLCPPRHQARTRRAAGARLPVPHRARAASRRSARPRRITKRT